MKYFVFVILLCSMPAWAQNSSTAHSNHDDLKSLGFTDSDVKQDIKTFEALQTRTKKLQLHQYMGFLTTALVLGAVLTAPEGEKPKEIHELLGYGAAASYAFTAYLSLSAPEPYEKPSSRWGLKIHKTLVWVHLPGMILTPIAGYLATKAYEDGKKPTGLAKYKQSIAGVTAAAIGLSALAITLEF